MFVLEGRVWYRGSLETLALGIEEGRIVAVKKTLRGDDRYDAGDDIVLPAGTDVHVHFREPGMTHKEDFASGTAGAACGGVTTVFDMPNTRPPATRRGTYDAKLARVRTHAHVDFGLCAGLTRPEDVETLADVAPAFKVYMAESTGGLQVEDEAVLDAVLGRARSTGRPVIVHAEDLRRLKNREAKGLADHLLARPPEAEWEALQRLAALPGNGRLHVAHVTTARGVDLAAGAGFTTEASPHHLLLDATARLGAFGKVNPPLRRPEDRDALFRAFVQGRVDIVASDHAPHTREEKEEPFAKAPAGMPGVETALPLLFRHVRRGHLSLARYVEATSARPAALFGLNKGEIEVGRQADLVVVDPRSIEPVRARRLHAKCGWTAFEGWEATFPRAVFLRGELLADEGELVAEGLGRPITAAKG